MYQNAFENGQWHHLNKDVDDYQVEFSGTMDIYEQPVLISIIFNVDNEGEISIQSVSTDNEVLDTLSGNLILDLVQLEHIKAVQK